MKEPKVGETYYCVFNDRMRLPENITVDKIGGKYFYCGYLKFNKNTFIQDNGKYSPFCSLYENKEQYELKLKATEYWMLIRDRLYRKMSNEEIIELYDKLKDR